jgi:hypothetical protein
MASPGPEDFVEVYRTESPIVAQKVLDVLLVPAGIHAVVHDRKETMFPGAGKPGAVYIAVARGEHERAVEIIDEAHENGFLEAAEGERV